MNMAPLGAEPDRISELFKDITQTKIDLEKEFSCKLNEVSMGMSQDYKIAVEAGSTMLRIGRKLFK